MPVSWFRRFAVALLLCAGLVATTSVVAPDPAQAETTCEVILSTYVDGTIRDWSNPTEIASHHFFVKIPIAGFHDMRGMVSSGQAQIAVNGQVMSIQAWEVNTWGVFTSWVVTHPLDFIYGRWSIRWTQWTDGVGCLIA